MLDMQTDLCYHEALLQEGHEMKNRVSKKQLAVELYEQGLRVDTIAELLRSDPAYIANALIERGHAPAYADLYTTTGPQNRYAQRLAGMLRFKDVAAARESVARIDEIYHEFEARRDRRGQHQAQLLALTGKNRAEGIGKRAEARVFAEWLIEHLVVEEEPLAEAGVAANRPPEREPAPELVLPLAA
jgi:predicted flap endonuclease-1-like 5' DNA nuclease